MSPLPDVFQPPLPVTPIGDAAASVWVSILPPTVRFTGIGAGFIPKVLDVKLVDDVVREQGVSFQQRTIPPSRLLFKVGRPSPRGGGGEWAGGCLESPLPRGYPRPLQVPPKVGFFFR